jgi:hypothetical protein
VIEEMYLDNSFGLTRRAGGCIYILKIHDACEKKLKRLTGVDLLGVIGFIDRRDTFAKQKDLGQKQIKL